MTWTEYYGLFEILLTKRPEVYIDDEIFHYTEMNLRRTDRVLKTYMVSEEVETIIKSIKTPQHWELITEHWCGDAAHATPVIFRLSELNPNIRLNIQLRDADSEIENYLTAGSRSIPKLIVRDEQDNDLFTWGPRPEILQDLYLTLRETDMSVEEVKIEIQKWYNKDKGVHITNEIMQLLKSIPVKEKQFA